MNFVLDLRRWSDGIEQYEIGLKIPLVICHAFLTIRSNKKFPGLPAAGAELFCGAFVSPYNTPTLTTRYQGSGSGKEEEP